MDRERAPLTEEEERLQEASLRENRSSPRVLKLFFTSWKEGEKFVISLFDFPRNSSSSFQYTSAYRAPRKRILVSGINRNFPSLPVIRNIFPSFPPLLRDYYYQSVEITEPSNATGFDIHVVHARVFNYDSDRN